MNNLPSPLIFPGQGAEEMLKFFATDQTQNIVSLPTERTMIIPGQFNLSVDFSSLPPSLDQDVVYVFDDVVATGQTATEVSSILKGKYPGIKVYLATWVLAKTSLKQGCLSGIPGIDGIFASFVVKGNYVKQPPINSLSCFVRNYEKYEKGKLNFMTIRQAGRNIERT